MFDNNPDWQRYVNEVAAQVDNLLPHSDTKRRKRFRQQVQLVINGYNAWRQAVLAAIAAAQEDESLGASVYELYPGDVIPEEAPKRKDPPCLRPGYDWLNLNDLPLDLTAGNMPAAYIQTPELPQNPLDVLVRRDFFATILPSDDECTERRPHCPAEQLMTDCFLLAVIQTYKGNGAPLIATNEDCLGDPTVSQTVQAQVSAADHVWSCYGDMNQQRRYYLETRFRAKITSALANVKADLESVEHRKETANQTVQSNLQATKGVIVLDPDEFNKGKTFNLLTRIVNDSMRSGVTLEVQETPRTLRSLKGNLKKWGYDVLANSLEWNNGHPRTTIPAGRIIILPRKSKK